MLIEAWRDSGCTESADYAAWGRDLSSRSSGVADSSTALDQDFCTDI